MHPNASCDYSVLKIQTATKLHFKTVQNEHKTAAQSRTHGWQAVPPSRRPGLSPETPRVAGVCSSGTTCCSTSLHVCRENLRINQQDRDYIIRSPLCVWAPTNDVLIESSWKTLNLKTLISLTHLMNKLHIPWHYSEQPLGVLWVVNVLQFLPLQVKLLVEGHKCPWCRQISRWTIFHLPL